MVIDVDIYMWQNFFLNLDRIYGTTSYIAYM
jgi:hypothetical protein